MAELIVALDVPGREEAVRVIRTIGPAVDFYKIGLELFCSGGPAVVDEVKRLGKRVFLDLKLHDIPRTVARAVASCSRMGVDLLTLHASGCRAMVEAAREAADAAGPAAPKLLAVTVLTSLDAADLSSLGIARGPAEQVEALGRLACGAGADGLVCSPREAAALRSALGPAALLATPGIRPSDGAWGDQKRVATPRDAVRAGATHLVVGRPVVAAADPRAAAEAIATEMRSA
ncbi:MAG: orotidine-5'-phosphate decarboxylase [Kiritimatiellia bacterium]|jgi:orotidine-5'-phosphate decarboxylase